MKIKTSTSIVGRAKTASTFAFGEVFESTWRDNSEPPMPWSATNELYVYLLQWFWWQCEWLNGIDNVECSKNSHISISPWHSDCLQFTITYHNFYVFRMQSTQWRWEHHAKSLQSAWIILGTVNRKFMARQKQRQTKLASCFLSASVVAVFYTRLDGIIIIYIVNSQTVLSKTF